MFHWSHSCFGREPVVRFCFPGNAVQKKRKQWDCLWRHPNSQKYLRNTEKSHDRDDSVANIDICVNRATGKMVMIATSVYGLVLGVGALALVLAVIVSVLLSLYTRRRLEAPGKSKEKQSSIPQHVPSCTATPLRKRSRVSSEADSRQVGSVRASSATVPRSVNYHFTRQCNYKCGFCFHTAKTSFVLPLEEARKGLRMLRDEGKRCLEKHKRINLRLNPNGDYDREFNKNWTGRIRTNSLYYRRLNNISQYDG